MDSSFNKCLSSPVNHNAKQLITGCLEIQLSSKKPRQQVLQLLTFENLDASHVVPRQSVLIKGMGGAYRGDLDLVVERFSVNSLQRVLN